MKVIFKLINALGFYEAYQGYEAELEPSIIEFVQTCMANPNKQLVLLDTARGEEL